MRDYNDVASSLHEQAKNDWGQPSDIWQETVDHYAKKSREFSNIDLTDEKIFAASHSDAPHVPADAWVLRFQDETIVATIDEAGDVTLLPASEYREPQTQNKLGVLDLSKEQSWIEVQKNSEEFSRILTDAMTAQCVFDLVLWFGKAKATEWGEKVADLIENTKDWLKNVEK